MDTKTVFLFVGIICCAIQRTTESISNEAQAIQEKCMKDFGLSKNDLYEASKKMLAREQVDESKRCFLECILREQGFIKDGKLNQEQFIQDAMEDADKKGIKEYEKKLTTGIAECAKTDGEGKCAASYNSWICVLNLMIKLHETTE